MNKRKSIDTQINQRDKEGHRHGLWIYPSNNGSVEYMGWINHGVYDRRWIKFSKRGFDNYWINGVIIPWKYLTKKS